MEKSIGNEKRSMLEQARALKRQPQFLVAPVFFLGAGATAAGITVFKSDTVVFCGIVTTGLGVIAMWVAEMLKENERITPKSLVWPLVFLAGAVLTGIAMTLSPSNGWLCMGMILSGVGTIAMWWMSYVEETGLGAVMIVFFFVTGVLAQAIGLTIAASDLLVLAGMIGTGIAVYGMWAYWIGKKGKEGDAVER